MNQQVHNNERENRTQAMRFYAFTFTGNDPRKGWRIPLNEIKYNEQRDEETGYGYFGARYMDHELMTMWLSVDPMADKYPNMSPYNYCAWTRPTGGDEHRWIKYNIVNNPVKLVDPNGKEWVVVFDHEKKTVTIEAKYIPIGGSHASVEMAIGTWNNLSGDYSLMVGKEKYNVVFNLSIIDPSETDALDPRQNTYKLVPELRDEAGNVDHNIMGQTNRRHISIRESEKDNGYVVAHEVGHSLGLLHPLNGAKGLMEEDCGMSSGHHEITKSNVESILRLAIHPEQRDMKYNSGIGSYEEIGSSKVDITKPANLRLIKNRKI